MLGRMQEKQSTKITPRTSLYCVALAIICWTCLKSKESFYESKLIHKLINEVDIYVMFSILLILLEYHFITLLDWDPFWLFLNSYFDLRVNFTNFMDLESVKAENTEFQFVVSVKARNI